MRELDPATQTAIVERAGGNPLHLELLQAYVADDHAPDETPDTVQALLSQRLDQLSPDELDVLRVASVLGQSVTRAGVIAARAGTGDDRRRAPRARSKVAAPPRGRPGR